MPYSVINCNICAYYIKFQGEDYYSLVIISKIIAFSLPDV